MQSLRRTAITAARKARTTLPRQPRRYAHDEHAHGHSHAPVNESFGISFWGTVACFPLGWALYAISRQEPNSPSFFTRLIDRYTEAQENLAAKNDIHVRMMEQAGSDRILFMNSKPQEFVDVRFPELLTSGSPYNVQAGSQANLEKSLAKFQQKAFEDNERKLEALQNNAIKSEQPFERFGVSRKAN